MVLHHNRLRRHLLRQQNQEETTQSQDEDQESLSEDPEIQVAQIARQITNLIGTVSEPEVVLPVGVTDAVVATDRKFYVDARRS